MIATAPALSAAAAVSAGLRRVARVGRAVRPAAAVALVAAGLGLLPGLWFALAWWAWSAGLCALAVPLGLLGAAALLVVGLLGLRAAIRPDDA